MKASSVPAAEIDGAAAYEMPGVRFNIVARDSPGRRRSEGSRHLYRQPSSRKTCALTCRACLTHGGV